MPPKANQNDQASYNKETPSKSGHLKKEDHLIIVNWLSVPKNYEDVFGRSRMGKVGRPPKSRVNGYHLMAMHLKSKTKGRINITTKQMTERFKNYRMKYRKAHMLASSSDFGLNEDDHVQGFKTVADKLDALCPYYDKMDQLFGNNANITQLNQSDAQESPSEEEEEEEEDDDEEEDEEESHDKEETTLNSPTELESSTPSHPPQPQISPGSIPPAEENIQRVEDDNRSTDLEAASSVAIKKKRRKTNTENNLNLSEVIHDHGSDIEEIHAASGLPKPSTRKRKALHPYDHNQKSHGKCLSEPSRSMAIREDFTHRKDSQKIFIAREELEFKKYQFNMTHKNEENSIKLEERKLSHTISLEEKRFELEKEEKKIEREFQWEKLQLENARHQREFERDQFRRKQEFSLECIRSGKSAEEIKSLISLLFP